jgi:hypothetical protein
MKRFFLLACFLLVFGITQGQDSLQIRRFDEARWKEIVNGVTYDEDSPEKKETEKKEEEAEEEESSGPILPAISPQILQFIGFGLVFLLFAYILYYVSSNTKLSQGVKSAKVTDVAAPVENIEELEIDGMLRNALANGDLRLAIRIHYLLLLKKLNEVGLITWKKDKTNSEYLSELYGRNMFFDEVRSLTLAYEMVWYGERSVTSESFERLSGSFESINRQIGQVSPAS